MTRRDFLSLAAKAIAGTSLGFALGPFLAAAHCTVTRTSVTMRGLPREFDGFRIALLTDLHHSAWIPRSYLRQIVDRTNLQDVDLITLTGDLIHCGRPWIPGCVSELSRLQARRGVVSVLGNHDHADYAAEPLRHALRSAGIYDLTNDGIHLRRRGAEFRIGGVGDLWRDRQRPRKALSGTMSAESALLLSHNPDYAETLRDERVGLMLSGHTHGGQVVIPGIGAPHLPSRYGQKYREGLCQGPVVRVYVSRGAGSSFPPVRIACPPEIAVITLRSAPKVVLESTG